MRDEIERWGWPRYLYSRLMIGLNRLVGLDVVWVTRRDLAQSRPAPPSIEVRLAAAEDLAPYIADPSYKLEKKYVNDAFARGDTCVATYLDGRLAAYGWVIYKAAPYDGEIWVDFHPGHRFTTSSFTHPDYRGRHIRGSFGALDALDRQHAVTHTLATIHTHNFASLRADARGGAKIVGCAGYVNTSKLFVGFRSPGAKKCGFRFRHAGRRNAAF